MRPTFPPLFFWDFSRIYLLTAPAASISISTISGSFEDRPVYLDRSLCGLVDKWGPGVTSSGLSAPPWSSSDQIRRGTPFLFSKNPLVWRSPLMFPWFSRTCSVYEWKCIYFTLLYFKVDFFFRPHIAFVIFTVGCTKSLTCVNIAFWFAAYHALFKSKALDCLL